MTERLPKNNLPLFSSASASSSSKKKVQLVASKKHRDLFSTLYSVRCMPSDVKKQFFLHLFFYLVFFVFLMFFFYSFLLEKLKQVCF